MAEKPRFRQRTVFAKNLGFGVGFGYRNNTIHNQSYSLIEAKKWLPWQPALVAWYSQYLHSVG